MKSPAHSHPPGTWRLVWFYFLRKHRYWCCSNFNEFFSNYDIFAKIFEKEQITPKAILRAFVSIIGITLLVLN